jgi:hypothetical protein
MNYRIVMNIMLNDGAIIRVTAGSSNRILTLIYGINKFNNEAAHPIRYSAIHLDA